MRNCNTQTHQDVIHWLVLYHSGALSLALQWPPSFFIKWPYLEVRVELQRINSVTLLYDKGLKGALCSFGEDFQPQNCITYNINEVIIQTEHSLKSTGIAHKGRRWCEISGRHGLCLLHLFAVGTISGCCFWCVRIATVLLKRDLQLVFQPLSAPPADRRLPVVLLITAQKLAVTVCPPSLCLPGVTHKAAGHLVGWCQDGPGHHAFRDQRSSDIPY